jgi:hypothetical protein
MNEEGFSINTDSSRLCRSFQGVNKVENITRGNDATVETVEIAKQPAIPTVSTVAWKSAVIAFFEININSGGFPHSHTCGDGFR